MQNRYINNNFMRDYSSPNRQGMNPLFSGNRDPNFQSRMNMAKMEQIKNAKNIKDLGMDMKELVKYVIPSIVIDKVTDDEREKIVSSYLENANVYNALTKYKSEVGTKNKNQLSSNVPKAIAELWEKQHNNPYKQILHDLKIEDYKKKYDKKEDLVIVHKMSLIEKAETMKKLQKKLADLEQYFEEHNKELKNIYSDDKRQKFLEEFEYANKYKNRIKYNPKNCSELKDIYKKEHKALFKESKRVDNMLNMILASEDLSKEELQEIKRIQEMEEEVSRKHKKNMKELEDRDEEEYKKRKKDSDDENQTDKNKNKNKIKTDETSDYSDKPKRRIVLETEVNETTQIEKPKRRIVLEENETKKIEAEKPRKRIVLEIEANKEPVKEEKDIKRVDEPKKRIVLIENVAAKNQEQIDGLDAISNLMDKYKKDMGLQ
jgi:hypothetical protein